MERSQIEMDIKFRQRFPPSYAGPAQILGNEKNEEKYIRTRDGGLFSRDGDLFSRGGDLFSKSRYTLAEKLKRVHNQSLFKKKIKEIEKNQPKLQEEEEELYEMKSLLYPKLATAGIITIGTIGTLGGYYLKNKKPILKEEMIPKETEEQIINEEMVPTILIIGLIIGTFIFFSVVK